MYSATLGSHPTCKLCVLRQEWNWNAASTPPFVLVYIACRACRNNLTGLIGPLSMTWLFRASQNVNFDVIAFMLATSTKTDIVL